MPDIKQVFQKEIVRLARKEVKQAVAPLKEQIRELGKTVRAQRQQISELEKQLPKKVDTVTAPETEVEAPEKEPEVRIAKGSFRRHRNRLGLSQKEMGLLMNVSALTISNWETEKMSPRSQNRQAFAELRNIDAPEARKRLKKLAAG